MAIDLSGVNSAEMEPHISTDYGIDSPRKAHQVSSNVQGTPLRSLQPAARQTLGRANQMFAFGDPLGRGSFLRDDTSPPDMPQPIRRVGE